MIDFVYTKDRLPALHAMCVIWQRKYHKDTGEEWVSANTHLAEMGYGVGPNGENLWKFVDTGEICNNQDVVKYIEILQPYWSGLTKKGKLTNRIRNWICGIRYREKKFEEKTYSPTITRKIICKEYCKQQKGD